jgi:3-deoxy-manno-octulosonate cytidylyltransferase (CMP-KDO synthetase)
MNILGIIPARYASSRFPGKMLVDIQGKSMVQRVFEQCLQAKSLAKVIVATDDTRIKAACEAFGATVVMTKPEQPSGTDRCFEAYQQLGEPYDFVINIQGDEPFIKPEQIDTLASSLNADTELSTLIKKIDNEDILWNPGNVKVTFNIQMEALYFSRQVIPHMRGIPEEDWMKAFNFHEHVGLYAYRTDILEEICQLPPSSLEVAESLEQLRWLENGYKIKLQPTEWDSFCIETPEDLQTALRLFF